MTERAPRKPPAALVDQWPDAPTSDSAAEAVRRFVIDLRDALGDPSLRAVARDAGLCERTIRHVLVGSVWPDP